MRVLILALVAFCVASQARAQTNVQARLRLSTQIEPRGVPAAAEAAKPKPAQTEPVKSRHSLKLILEQRHEERLRARVEEAIREATFGRRTIGLQTPASFADGVPYQPLSNDPSKVPPAGFGFGTGF